MKKNKEKDELKIDRPEGADDDDMEWLKKNAAATGGNDKMQKKMWNLKKKNVCADTYIIVRSKSLDQRRGR